MAALSARRHRQAIGLRRAVACGAAAGAALDRTVLNSMLSAPIASAAAWPVRSRRGPTRGPTTTL